MMILVAVLVGYVLGAGLDNVADSIEKRCNKKRK